MSKPATIAAKIWANHIVEQRDDGTCLIYVDRHLIHEVTSPQAFEGLRLNNRKVRRPSASLATPDHNVPTQNRASGISDEESRVQVETLDENCRTTGIQIYGMEDLRQGVVHVVGPEQGLTQPGMTIVCGDSHTATHGAFGALAFGIGTSEVEHTLASQTLLLKPLKDLRIHAVGTLGDQVGAKDLILAIIGKIGTAGGTGYVIEYTGEAIRSMSMESRMTVCNMSIEAGARAGLIAPDEVTFEYLKGRPVAPPAEHWDAAVEYWKALRTDEGAVFDKEVEIDVSTLAPQVSWGTSPEQVIPVSGSVPKLSGDEASQQRTRRACEYMGLEPGQEMAGLKIDAVFIGSCTNGRIEDLRIAADVARGRKVASNVRALVVPGSGLVRQQAESEGLDKVFSEAGFEWREPGCSMCLAMNADKLKPRERCASTSNRNFEGRQGRGGRTHLLSPQMAAAAAIEGRIVDVRELA